MVDKPLILRKLSELDDLSQQLQEYATISATDYASDWKTQRIVERTLHVMIEICLDVSGHIISDSKLRVPTSYADTFRVLYENRILDKNLCQSMEKMAKFRNLLVHAYEKIDPGPIVDILKNDLDDFKSFRSAVLSHIS